MLGGWLVWTSIGGSMETYTSPAGLTRGDGTTYRLNGMVAPGAPHDAAERAQGAAGLRFVVLDKKNASVTVPVVYRGSVPGAFKVGREIVVTGHMRDGVFVADNVLAKHDENYVPRDLAGIDHDELRRQLETSLE